MSCRLIAFYLPQFHPVPENDEWWGKGFTEWTNVTKARPVFLNHYQPRLPADLGFYDLRLPETREAQAAMARKAGIEGFCYYHYWFAGKRILERPFKEVVASGQPTLPFCLCWANQTWSGIWHGSPNQVLIEQTYPGPGDEQDHFLALLPAFRDPRYIKVDGRLLFTVFRPAEIPDPKAFTEHWQSLAKMHGLPGFHFVAHFSVFEKSKWDYREFGFEAAVLVNNLKAHRIGPEKIFKRAWQEAGSCTGLSERGSARYRALKHYGWYMLNRLRRKIRGPLPHIALYEDSIRFFLDGVGPNEFPCVVPNWDNTARSGSRGFVLHGSTPELFEGHLRAAARLVQARAPEQQIIFVKSWNEWAEGNYLEPDRRFGHAYLDVVKRVLGTAEKESGDSLTALLESNLSNLSTGGNRGNGAG